jgi:hypothetical protein
MTAAVLSIGHGLSAIAPAPGTAGLAVRLFAAIGGGLLALAFGAKVLGISEFDGMVGELRSRVQKLL